MTLPADDTPTPEATPPTRSGGSHHARPANGGGHVAGWHPADAAPPASRGGGPEPTRAPGDPGHDAPNGAGDDAPGDTGPGGREVTRSWNWALPEPPTAASGAELAAEPEPEPQSTTPGVPSAPGIAGAPEPGEVVAGGVPVAGPRRGGRRLARPGRRRRNGRGTPADGPVTGVARVDRRTKRLVKRLRPGDVAVIDHEDLDRVAAETLVDAAPVAVVNAAPSVSGRYPNLGPLLLCQAGIPLLDDVGPAVMDSIHEGAPITIDGDRVLVGSEVVATGTRQTLRSLDAAIDEARANIGPELERFVENTVEYIRQEIELLTGRLDVPALAVDLAGRHALIVVRGIDYKSDLSLLQQSGYVRDVHPVTIGVDGGADALLEIGVTPDLIIGDFDSVSERALRCGAQLIVHGYADGRAPGAKRLDDLGLDYAVCSAPGTSEDVAMLIAYQEGAELMVAVGTHNSMVEFLDKGRGGMASTFLVRMRVGATLVDAKGVSRLYRTSVRTRDLLWMILAAVFTLAVAMMLSEPVRLVLRAFWRSLFSN
jgi:uncharacterized membrane-anchored protein